MPTLGVTDFNIVLTVLGGWISLSGLVSYLFKETFYLSEPLISLLAGVAFSPRAANLIRPIDYVGGSARSLDAATLAFSRLVLGVQLMLAGVQLPSRYLRQEWRSLALLLGPVMVAIWLVTSLLVWALVIVPLQHGDASGAGLLWALAIGACVTPTDPVLSGVIVKGRFADRNVPTELQRLIVAESGANDGLGYPFLLLPLLLIRFLGGGIGSNNVGDATTTTSSAAADAAVSPLPPGGLPAAMGQWFGETWGYIILLGATYGAVAGWAAKEMLHWAERRRFVDRESFLVFAISLALFITGTCGMLGSDDVLACFVAGNVFTWDDWFRLETKDDSLQPTVDMLLNVAIFMWYGAVCPWDSFLYSEVVPLWRLVLLGVLVLALRRLPAVLATHRLIPQIVDGDGGVGGVRQALFVGFFGPIGVSAVFYLQVALETVEALRAADGTLREDVRGLPEALTVVVWFLTICSVVIHGLSIPFGKLVLHMPQKLRASSPGKLSRFSTVAILESPSEGLPITAPPTVGRPPSASEEGPTRGPIRGRSAA